MKSEILDPGAFPMVRVELAAGENIKAESGAMVACSPTIDIESKMEGGFLGALSRKFLTGEKFFFQTLRASRGPRRSIAGSDGARRDCHFGARWCERVHGAERWLPRGRRRNRRTKKSLLLKGIP